MERVAPLHVDGVTLRFGGITALDGVSFTVAPGSVHALIGPNGAGKSSCFNVISGLYRPTAGVVRLGGRRHSCPGCPPTRGVYIAKVDAKAEGGLTEVAPLFTAPDVAGYKAPFQK